MLQEKSLKRLFLNLMAESISELLKDMNTQIQKAQVLGGIKNEKEIYH